MKAEDKLLTVFGVVLLLVLSFGLLLYFDKKDVFLFLVDVWTGMKILFWTGLTLTGSGALIWLYKQFNDAVVIRPGKHGKAQAVKVRSKNGEVYIERLDTWSEEASFEMMNRFMQLGKLWREGQTKEIGMGKEMLGIAAPAGQVTVTQLPLTQAVSKLEQNKLQVYWGTREDGQDCIINLEDATHVQKSGQTGLGKSWLTWSELYCLHKCNDPGIIRFAYIDLEGETTEAFQGEKHLWQYTEHDGNGHTALYNGIASELEQVLPLLKAIDTELAYRDEHKKEQFYTLLVVIEEAEELLESLSDLSKAEQKEIIKLLKRIARRGRKRRIRLDINVQNTYTDPIFRAAQRQFQLKITAAQQPSTAQAGGFQNLEMLKRLFKMKSKGLFMVSHETGEYIIRTPFIDVPMFSDEEADEIEGEVTTLSASDFEKQHQKLDTASSASEAAEKQPVDSLEPVSTEAMRLQEKDNPLVIFSQIQRRKILEAAEAGTARRDIPAAVGFGGDKFKAMGLWLDSNGYTVAREARSPQQQEAV